MLTRPNVSVPDQNARGFPDCSAEAPSGRVACSRADDARARGWCVRRLGRRSGTPLLLLHVFEAGGEGGLEGPRGRLVRRAGLLDGSAAGLRFDEGADLRAMVVLEGLGVEVRRESLDELPRHLELAVVGCALLRLDLGGRNDFFPGAQGYEDEMAPFGA